MSLLAYIKAEIASTGGRIAMGHLITTEAREWFTEEERKYFADRHKWEQTRKKKTGQKPRKDTWSKEDIEFVLEQYGSVKTSKIGAIIGRTSTAIRIKFSEVATPEQKEAASLRNNSSRKTSNFK